MRCFIRGTLKVSPMTTRVRRDLLDPCSCSASCREIHQCLCIGTVMYCAPPTASFPRALALPHGRYLGACPSATIDKIRGSLISPPPPRIKLHGSCLHTSHCVLSRCQLGANGVRIHKIEYVLGHHHCHSPSAPISIYLPWRICHPLHFGRSCSIILGHIAR